MNDFLNGYVSEYVKLINLTSSIDEDLNLLISKIENISKSGKKIICQGNGGSAAIASHFTVDLSKNANIRAINFNESDLITCLANDYGYENWVKEALEMYADKGDLIILISSSGESKNILNACNYCFENDIKVATFTGMNESNSLKTLNKNGVNFFVPSKAYNFIENVHQFWLLFIVDQIIGSTIYPANKKSLL